MSTENEKQEKHTPDVEDEWLAVDAKHAKLIASAPASQRRYMNEVLSIVTDMARCVRRQSRFFDGCDDPTHTHGMISAEEACQLAHAFLRFTAGYGFDSARNMLEVLVAVAAQGGVGVTSHVISSLPRKPAKRGRAKSRAPKRKTKTKRAGR